MMMFFQPPHFIKTQSFKHLHWPHVNIYHTNVLTYNIYGACFHALIKNSHYEGETFGETLWQGALRLKTLGQIY